MTTVAVVYHSETGRTRALAEAVVRGALSTGGGRTVTAQLFSVDEATRSHEALAAADAIIFGCPTYMGSASASFKAFMDATSTVWALQAWEGKLSAGFTHSAAPSGDKLGTLTQLAIFAAQHGMIWIGLGLPPTYAALGAEDDEINRLGSHLGAMAHSRPGGGVPSGDLKTAEHLGQRVALAASRWRAGEIAARSQRDDQTRAIDRHHATRSWVFPPPDRAPLPDGVSRQNLRELMARPSRYEHHLTVCAAVDDVQLEVTTASEPLYFAHINLSDEYAIALPTGDELVDRFPLRTFLSDPISGADLARYNHRIGDLVLHPEGILHWPGRLRPPYEPFAFPPGTRRCGLSLVYCASKSMPATWCPLPVQGDRAGDAKPYVSPGPPMVLASMRSAPGMIARIGRTTLTLVELPDVIAPLHGGWVVVLEAEAGSAHAPCDLLRIPSGASVAGKGIVRALVLASDVCPPDAVPPLWTVLPPPPFSPFEEGAPGSLPAEVRGDPGSGGLPKPARRRTGPLLRFCAASPSVVTVTVSVGEDDPFSTEVPRYWLARMLFRIALHGLRLGYVETYGGFFADDREGPLALGIRTDRARHAVTVPREHAIAVLERVYRAVAPLGYRELPR